LLKDLSFTSGKLKNVILEKLTNLTTLDLRSNQITKLVLNNFAKLSKISIQSNPLETIELTNLPLLKDLSFTSGKLKNVILEKLTNLTTLDLRYNKITDIRFLENLTNLTSLDLRYNKITDIKPLLPLIELGKMKVSLEEYNFRGKLNLYNNPLENPPIEIVKQGNAAIIKYFEELEKQETIELYEAKLLIIGEGGVGKTSLLRKFMSEANKLPEEEEMTKGIDIQEYHFKTAEQQDFRINLWDFGGQEIYHSTHQFFLTKRSLYVLVDDTRKDDKTIHDATFNYWLQTVELFGGESPIVIVQNEKGDRSKVLDLKSIQSKFSNVKETYATNLLTCRNLAETKKALEFFIQQLPHIGTKLPKSWVDIRNEVEDLERSGTYYISQKEYFAICKKHNVEQDAALILSQYFHDLGVFLHFQKNDALCKTVILQNEWATDAATHVKLDKNT
jgi:GTPase SAR1 family protein